MAAATIDYDKLAQQHGATGVDYDALAAQHGAVATPAVQTAPAPHPLMAQMAQGAKNVGIGAAKGLLHTVSGADDWARQHLPAFMTNSNFGFGPPANLEHVHQMATPQGTAQKVGYGGEQVGEFLIPGGAEEGLTAKVAEFAPKIKPLARIAASALGAGTVNKAQGGSFGAGAAGGAVGGAVGEGLRLAAPAMAETALRVRGNDRLYGRTVGRAILDDTHGILPSSVASSAQDTISQLTPQLEQQAAEAGANGARGSLVPARESVASTIGKHALNRATDSKTELTPLVNRLATDSETGLPLAEQQSPTGLLQLKRGINSDFIQNWRPDQPPGLRSSAKTAYGKLADEFHIASPGTAELDQRISSLIPVVKRAEGVDRNAGLLQRTAGRLMAHTGAATLGGLGAAGGYREGGIPGAIAGGAAGIIAPELLTSPGSQMMAARSFNSPVLRNGMVPLVNGAALQFDRKSKSDPER